MMASVCILTDTSAQFTQPSFAGRDLVRTIPLQVQLNGKIVEENQGVKTINLPLTASDVLSPRLHAPSVDEFRTVFSTLGQSHHKIITILLSSQLNPAVENAREAAASLNASNFIEIIDSQTTSVGLGVLVQTAASAAVHGASANDIIQSVRSLIPHIYTILCIPGFSYLSHSGIVDPSQALVGEMLGLMAIFALEEGRLSPLEKVKNLRSVFEIFQEFLEEFYNLHQIALFQNSQPAHQEVRALRERAEELFPGCDFTEHMINPPLATLFGPRTLGLVAVETPDD